MGNERLHRDESHALVFLSFPHPNYSFKKRRSLTYITLKIISDGPPKKRRKRYQDEAMYFSPPIQSIDNVPAVRKIHYIQHPRSGPPSKSASGPDQPIHHLRQAHHHRHPADLGAKSDRAQPLPARLRRPHRLHARRQRDGPLDAGRGAGRGRGAEAEELQGAVGRGVVAAEEGEGGEGEGEGAGGEGDEFWLRGRGGEEADGWREGGGGVGVAGGRGEGGVV